MNLHADSMYALQMPWRGALCSAWLAFVLSIAWPASLWAASGIHGALPAALDLQRDATHAIREAKPVLLFFTLPGCPYCHAIRQNYLEPMLRDLPPAQRPIIREVDLASASVLVDFAGRSTSQKEFAKSRKVRFAPTIHFVDGGGRALVDPLVGGDTTGLYGGLLENGLQQAARKMPDKRQAHELENTK